MFFGGDIGAVADEVFVGFFGEAELLTFKAEIIALVVYGFDALEEFFVEHDVVAMGRDFWSHFFGDGLHFVAVDAFDEVEKDRANLVEKSAALFEGLDGVLESRSLVVVDNGVDFGLLAFHALLEGGHIVFGFYFFEVGDVIRSVPFSEERVVHIVFVFARCA